jgi:hypothetical protein
MTETLPLGAINIWAIVKVLALVLLAMYLVFAFVIVRQVKVMTQTLHLGFDSPAKLLSYLHFGFAVFVFIAALIIL